MPDTNAVTRRAAPLLVRVPNNVVTDSGSMIVATRDLTPPKPRYSDAQLKIAYEKAYGAGSYLSAVKSELAGIDYSASQFGGVYVQLAKDAHARFDKAMSDGTFTDNPGADTAVYTGAALPSTLWVVAGVLFLLFILGDV